MYWQNRLKGTSVTALKAAGRLIIFAVVHFGPAGISGWVVKSLAHSPLKYLLRLLLASVLRSAMSGALAGVTRERREQSDKRPHGAGKPHLGRH